MVDGNDKNVLAPLSDLLRDNCSRVSPDRYGDGESSREHPEPEVSEEELLRGREGWPFSIPPGWDDDLRYTPPPGYYEKRRLIQKDLRKYGRENRNNTESQGVVKPDNEMKSECHEEGDTHHSLVGKAEEASLAAVQEVVATEKEEDILRDVLKRKRIREGNDSTEHTKPELDEVVAEALSKTGNVNVDPDACYVEGGGAKEHETQLEEESWLTVKKRNYEEHCRDCDAGYDLGGPRLTWDEFCMQQTIDEDEFGPSDNVETIWRECNDEPWLRKEREFQYRMKLNRFFAVQKIKRQRREMEEKGKV